MDRGSEQWRFKDGDEVRSADDQKLGKIIGFWPDMVEPTHLVVEKGLLVHHDYYVPVSAVVTYNGERIYLDATKAEVQARGWDLPPLESPPAMDDASAPW